MDYSLKSHQFTHPQQLQKLPRSQSNQQTTSEYSWRPHGQLGSAWGHSTGFMEQGEQVGTKTEPLVMCSALCQGNRAQGTCSTNEHMPASTGSHQPEQGGAVSYNRAKKSLNQMTNYNHLCPRIKRIQFAFKISPLK